MSNETSSGPPEQARQWLEELLDDTLVNLPEDWRRREVDAMLEVCRVLRESADRVPWPGIGQPESQPVGAWTCRDEHITITAPDDIWERFSVEPVGDRWAVYEDGGGGLHETEYPSEALAKAAAIARDACWVPLGARPSYRVPVSDPLPEGAREAAAAWMEANLVTVWDEWKLTQCEQTWNEFAANAYRKGRPG